MREGEEGSFLGFVENQYISCNGWEGGWRRSKKQFIFYEMIQEAAVEQTNMTRSLYMQATIQK